MARSRMVTPQARDAAAVLGLQVAQARRERQWTAEALAARANISVVTLRKVERGDPSVSLGTALEVATLVGVPLFSADRTPLSQTVAHNRDRLALLPQRVRVAELEPNDDF